MAQKRMVSDNICDTVTFTEMSASARALYLHLHCASDEDGCCNGAKVLKSAKLRNSALDELIKNGYAIPLVNTPPKERIVYLADWHNLNRYRHALNNAPVYRKQLLETIPDIQNALFEAKNDTVFAPSIGKLSKGKSSQGKSSGYYGAAKPPVRRWRSHLSGLTEPPFYYQLLPFIGANAINFTH